jgi:phosphatidylserine decarboxylase
MVRDAYRFLIPLVICAVLLLYWGFPGSASLAGLLAAFVGFFFRNPSREIPAGPGVIVAPADGKVLTITDVEAPGVPGARGRQVSIFLSIFDVHVNRAPIGGRLEGLEYHRGRYLPAYDAAASRVNEQNILTISDRGTTVVMKQIAGLIARRVVCWKKPGDALERGELIGLIRFGSRVDLLLPVGARLMVREGDRVRGGSSVIGELV